MEAHYKWTLIATAINTPPMSAVAYAVFETGDDAPEDIYVEAADFSVTSVYQFSDGKIQPEIQGFTIDRGSGIGDSLVSADGFICYASTEEEARTNGRAELERRKQVRAALPGCRP